MARRSQELNTDESYRIVWSRNTDDDQPIYVKKQDGTAYDLSTLVSAWFAVKGNPLDDDTAAVIRKNILGATGEDLVNGKLVVHLTKSESNIIPIGRMLWDIRLEFPGNVEKPIPRPPAEFVMFHTISRSVTP